MPKNYTDFVDAMHEARAAGLSVDTVVLTSDSMETFLTDGKFTDTTEEKHNDLGEFNIPITEGHGDYVLTESGERFPL